MTKMMPIGTSAAQQASPSRRPAIRRRIVAALLVAFVLSLSLGAVVAREAIELRRDLRRAQVQFDLAAGGVDPLTSDLGSFRQANEALQASASHLSDGAMALSAARRRAKRLRPMFTLAGASPGWPKGLKEIAPLIEAADGVARSGLVASASFARVTASLDTPADGSRPAGARLAAALDLGEPGFRDAATQLDAAVAARQGIDARHLAGPLASARKALDSFDQRSTSARAQLALLAQLPVAVREVVGMNGARTYVVLGQNSAELRPTGGFIGSMGLITFDGGALTREDYRSSYSFDNPGRPVEPLPAAMAAHLGPGAWAVRDANWSPDFPTSAAKVEAILAREQDIEADGVIAFTTSAVGTILDELGPLPVEGIAEPVTAAAWYGLAEQLIYFSDPASSVEGTETRKGEVLGPILRAIVARVQAASPAELPRVLRALRRATEQRELFVSFREPGVATLAERYHADGRLAPPAQGDALAVIDANLSYSKVGPYVRERISYEVWLNERAVAERSQLTVTYENRVTAEQLRAPNTRIYGGEWDAARGAVVSNPGVFGTYVRVYVPAKSRVRNAGEAQPASVTREELGFTTFEHYESVPAAGTRRFSYTYQIPSDRNLPGEYRLRLFKQAGTMGREVEVRLHLPVGMAASADPPIAREQDDLVYRGALTENVDLRVVLSSETR